MSSRTGLALTKRAADEDAAAYTGKNRVFAADGVTEVRAEDLPMLRAGRRGEIVIGEELVLERGDGTRIPLLCNAAPIWDDEGAIVGAVLAYQDISQRKRMEDALRESDRRKDEFIAILSHELRNPLAPIRYALPILERERVSDTAARAIAVIDRQVQHLARLVDDLLDVSRITRGKVELRPERVTLASVVSAAVEASSPALSAAGQSLGVRMPEIPIWLNGDPARLAQVLTNLLDNAAKYTPRGGEVVLEAGRDNGEAVIAVRDNGIGIPPESMPTLFEMFHQVSRPESRGGLGIGLALVKRLVQMHGGTVEARSEGAGQGAEFVVRIPVVDPAAAAEGPPEAVPVPADTPRLRVLVVDDNVDLAQMLALVVEGAGHEVHQAFDGRSAVESAVTCRPHVVFLDLGLPDISGIEVARELRCRLGTAAPRLVALTGWGQIEDRRRTGDAGFDHHLTKPTDPKELLRLLADCAEWAEPR
jgi:signal transduction histidine kinase/ActR/RegA family two-component response regulator